MTYELRPALWEDNPFLETLYADVHGAEFASLSLPEPALAQLVTLKFKAERMALAASYPDADHSIISVGNTGIGHLLLNETPTEIQLIDVALLAPLRGAGVGASIIEQLQAFAVERRLPLRLSVHPQNPAARLFERLGFVTIGVDTNRSNMEWNAPSPISDRK
jgi:ribosomal protein S18 acetylase RimI-like enzyme